MKNNIIEEDLENIYNRNIDWKIFDGKTVLVTGAYGMLASYIVFLLAFLNDKNIFVNIIVMVRTKKKFIKRFGNEFLKKYPVQVIESDLKGPIIMNGNIDYIIHAASFANPEKYTTNPVEVIEPNVLGTYYLLNLAKEKNVKGFLFFSSGDIYGSVDNPDCIDEDTVGKMDPLDAHSCYGESKRMGETLCEAFFREYDVPIKIARIGHTYGPTMDVESDPRVFASMVKCALKGEDIIMRSDGMARRPFCYLADATAAYILILLNGISGEAYNVCNTKEFLSIKEFAEIVATLREDVNINIIYRKREAKDTYLENRVNKDNKPQENKLRNLGWNTLFSTREGLKRTISYFQEGD